MGIFVTPGAFARQTKISGAFLFDIWVRVNYKGRFMTDRALFFCMYAIKFKPRQVVVEFIFVKMDDLKIPAMMVAVTRNTCF